MRIAFIGNSHLAALKLGWEKIFSDYSIEAVFYGSIRNNLRAFVIRDGALWPTHAATQSMFVRTSGRDHIRPDFDRCVVTGFGSSVNRPMQRLSTHRVVEIYDPEGPHQLISDACRRDIVHAELAHCTALKIIRGLRSISQAQIILAPDPYASHEILSDPRYEHWADPTVRRRMLDDYREAVDKFLRPEVEVVLQPSSTVVDEMFTRPEFSHGSVRLGTDLTHAPGDMFHANSDFGVVYLRELIPHLM